MTPRANQQILPSIDNMPIVFSTPYVKETNINVEMTIISWHFHDVKFNNESSEQKRIRHEQMGNTLQVFITECNPQIISFKNISTDEDFLTYINAKLSSDWEILLDINQERFDVIFYHKNDFTYEISHNDFDRLIQTARQLPDTNDIKQKIIVDHREDIHIPIWQNTLLGGAIAFGVGSVSAAILAITVLTGGIAGILIAGALALSVTLFGATLGTLFGALKNKLAAKPKITLSAQSADVVAGGSTATIGKDIKIATESTEITAVATSSAIESSDTLFKSKRSDDLPPLRSFSPQAHRDKY